MKCQNLFSENNKKNISIDHLLKISPRVLSVKTFNITKRNDIVSRTLVQFS